MIDNTLWFVVALILLIIFLLIASWMYYLQRKINNLNKKLKNLDENKNTT